MRTITDHHDGFGLNDAIVLVADEPDPKAGNASHRYTACVPADAPPAFRVITDVQFQHGPRHVEGSLPGVTERVLLTILIDRLRAFQSSPFACAENAQALAALVRARDMLHERVARRAAAGTLGTTTPDKEDARDEDARDEDGEE